MRRFSQRHSLVTLSDINITPLLDLAFVLLIIFMITAPLLENSLNLRLPEGGQASATVPRENVRTVEIDKTGRYILDRKEVSIQKLEELLVGAYKANPRLVINIRADQETMTKHLYPVIDRCTRNGIRSFSLRTEPPRSR